MTVFRVNINGFFARKVNYSTPPDLLVKKEPLDDTCKQLTSALEYQLHEIEKQVKNNSKQQQKPVTSNGGHRDGGQSAKFGSSMREMLKSVVSSQKNVLTKQKVENLSENVSTQSPKNSSKVGKFFQTLTKNPLSKSNQSLALSKESLNLDSQQKPLETVTSGSVSYSSKDSKRRSKSLTTESRNTLSSGNKSRTGELGATNRSKWIGKNPFEMDKSPTNEV